MVFLTRGADNSLLLQTKVTAASLKEVTQSVHISILPFCGEVVRSVRFFVNSQRNTVTRKTATSFQIGKYTHMRLRTANCMECVCKGGECEGDAFRSHTR